LLPITYSSTSSSSYPKGESESAAQLTRSRDSINRLFKNFKINFELALHKNPGEASAVKEVAERKEILIK
jgi:hypothetical protein